MPKNIFIASEVRSGSTFIAESIAYGLNLNLNYELWDLTKECFNSIISDTQEKDLINIYESLGVDKISGFVASKIMVGTLPSVCRIANKSKRVDEIFFGEETVWIIVRRRNRLAQAVSLSFAHKSGIYHNYGASELSMDNDITIDPKEIMTYINMISLSDFYLESFLIKIKNIKFVQVYYEDFMENPSNYLKEIYRCCEFPLFDHFDLGSISKLIPTASEQKKYVINEFSKWFVLNF
jgi:hypothetical protein